MKKKTAKCTLAYDDALSREISRLVRAALSEDHAACDVTSRLAVPLNQQANAVIVAKADGVLAGSQCLVEVFSQVRGKAKITCLKQDGSKITKGMEIFQLSGNLRTLLAGERTALNFLQHLSGVATLTRRYVDKIKGTKAKIHDTRKTTPGYRYLEKHAVRMGAGCNHRMNLCDMVLLKENHLFQLCSKGTETAGRKIMSFIKKHPHVPVIIEVENIAQLRWALELDAAIVLLDNMQPARLRRAVAIAKTIPKKRRPLLEASGRVTLANVRTVAETGVDRIAIGAITHSAPALDIAMYINSL